MGDREKALLWRRRAEEVRTIAERFIYPDARRDLLALADKWDAMALHLEMTFPRPRPAKLAGVHR
jgi:hypothetical protein